ncbi:aspartate aminotransferase family protein [Acidisoma silvae]|uniref:Aspartate aminotransferase family protein n=1 Tax=Acidisoma silvae TaxID=2802396 RepID=A0A963YPE3_9PROT|nr:aspartate aminotransferase family protein [Acidisoma silvae]MCB8874311.1 aspartate aminotransferase family protein [Acidisoma silvae]
MSHLLHRGLRDIPPQAVSAEGLIVRLADGREIIDASGGAAVSCLGHGHPRVIAALRAQVETLPFAYNGFFTTAPAEALADRLVGAAPGGLTHAYFVSGGSEANEAAIKLARQYFVEIGQTQRHRFIARRQSYHGNTLGALSAGGNMARRALYQPLLSDAFSHVSPAFAYRGQEPAQSEADYVARLAAELEAEFQRVGPDRVAAFIAEPVVGATLGAATAPAGYFQAMRAVCDRHGALLLLDEVMCGMGRTGTLHAWEQEGVAPDIQMIAKGLGGGYQPIGGILISGRIIAALEAGSGAFAHGHTYLAHATACAAALAVQQVIADDDLLANVRAMGIRLDDRLRARFGNHAHIGDVRGRGLFQAIELVADRDTKTPFDPGLRLHERIKAEAFARGMACYPMGGTIDGRRGDHVLLAPPYIATGAEIDRIVEILGEAVDAAIWSVG